jgi:hypothetical protein
MSVVGEMGECEKCNHNRIKKRQGSWKPQGNPSHLVPGE